MSLNDRIRQAEDDLNAALTYTADLALARRQVTEALDDLRVYRSVLALKPYAVPRESPEVSIPQQRGPRKLNLAKLTEAHRTRLREGR